MAGTCLTLHEGITSDVALTFEDPSQVPYGGSPPMLMYVMAHCTQANGISPRPALPGFSLTKALPFAC